MTRTGGQCLVPFADVGSRMIVNSCFKRFESEKTLQCPTMQARNPNEYLQMDNELFDECHLEHCQVLDTCGTNSMKTSGELVSREVPFLFKSINYYPLNTECFFNFTSEADENYYSFTFYRLDVHCEDAVKLGDASESFGYNLCTKTSSIGFNPFTLCMPASQVSLEFKTGDANDGDKEQRSGFMATYEQVRKSECEIEPEDSACSFPAGRTVTSETTVKGKFYPLPYPANSSCLWNIETQKDYQLIKITVVELDLGIFHNEFEVTDSIFVRDYFDRSVTYLPETAQLYSSFFSMSPNASILFESGFFFNWHNNFQLDVSFLNLTNNLDQFVEAGFCTSTNVTSFEDNDICRFPFIYKGQKYESCDFLEESDQSPTCMSYKNKKVVCDTSNTACITEFPVFTGYNVEYANNTAVNISWTTSNKFWQYFNIYVNKKPVQENVKELSFSLSVPSNGSTTLVEIKMIQFIYRTRSLHLTLRPDLGLEIGSSYNILNYTIKWDQNKNFTSIKQSVDQTVDAKLFELAGNLEIDLTNKTDNLTTNQYTAKGLTPGLVYQYELSGSSGPAETFDFSLPPNEIPKEDIKFEETATGNGDIIILSGGLTRSTIASSISFEAQATTAETSERRRRSAASSSPKVCSLADGCINSTSGAYSVDLSDQVLDPGTCYQVSVTSSTNDISSDPTTITFCTRPPPVDEKSVIDDVSTVGDSAIGRLSLRWDKPDPANFDYYVITVLHCTSCDCDSGKKKEYHIGGYQLNVEAFTLDDLEPGVKHFVTIKTRKTYPPEVQKESAEVSLEFDTKPSKAHLVTVSFLKFALYLNWATPQLDDGASAVTSVGSWSNFQVTFYKVGVEKYKVSHKRATGASLAHLLNFTEFGEVYEVKLETLSCNEDESSLWGSLTQVSVPTTAPADKFSIKTLTSSSFEVRCNLTSSSDSSIKFTFFRIVIADVTSTDGTSMFCNGTNLKFSDGINPNTAYVMQISTVIKDSGSEVTEVYSKPIELNVTTYPDGSVFEYIPSDILSFSDIKVGYNFSGVLKTFKSVILSARSVEDSKKQPIETEAPISSLTGTITSSGHLRNETYEVTIALKVVDDDDFVAKKFTTEPLTYTTTTDFKVERTGYVSVLISADDTENSSMTQYVVEVTAENGSLTREITFEKAKVCNESPSVKCQLQIDDLEPQKLYNFALFTVFNGFKSVNEFDLRAMTLPLDEVFQYQPSDILTFNEINVNYNFTKFSQEISSVVLSAQSVEDSNKQPIETEAPISSLTGTITSSGHLRNETYEVTITLNFVDGDDFVAKKFTTELLTYTTTTDFKVERTGYVSVLISADDTENSSMTQYVVEVTAENGSLTREITFEKAKVCNESPSVKCQLQIDDLEPQKLYNFTLFTVFNGFKSVNEFDLRAMTLPLDEVFQYQPSDILTFNEINVNYNFTKFSQEISSVVLSAQSVEDSNKQPIETEAPISSLTGTITSSGHLRNETYEVTITLNFVDGDDFVAKKFTTELLTYTTTTDFKVERTGYVSVLISADDTENSSMTQYVVEVTAENGSLTREITFEKAKVCNESPSLKCQLQIDDLEPQKLYNFTLFTVFNGFKSVNEFDLRAMTLPLDEVFQYQPSDILTFNEINVNYNFTKFSQEISSVVLSAQSVEDSNKQPIETEAPISSLTGTITSSGHLRNETYEVTITLNFVDGDDFVAKKFTTELLTYTTTTDFKVERTGYVSVLISADDTENSSMTQYVVEVTAENGSLTREITFEKAKVCNESPSLKCHLQIDDLEPQKLYNFTLFTVFNGFKSVNEFDLRAMTLPLDEVFQYQPSDILTFNEINVNYNFTKFSQEISSVVLSAQSVEDSNKQPIETEAPISSLTGTITSSGHLRNETYEVTITLNFVDGDDFVAKKFTTELLTYTTTTDFKVERTGYVSVLISADDTENSSMTQYVVEVTAENGSLTREITFEKAKVCNESPSLKCHLQIDDLEPQKLYNFTLFTVFNGFKSVNEFDLRAMTLPLDEVFQYQPSDILTFNEINVNYNFTKFSQEISSVVLSAQSVEDSNKQPIETEAPISSLTGIITSTGHLRDEKYEVTLTLKFGDGKQLVMETFTTELITFTSTTTFILETTGLSSVFFSANDTLNFSLTQYSVVVRADDKSQTKETIFEKEEVCEENRAPECQLYIHGLQSETSYEFELFTIFNGFRSVNNFTFKETTVPLEDSVDLKDFSETSITITLPTSPFMEDSSIKIATVLVGVNNDKFNTIQGPFNNWNKVLGNDKDSATGDKWVYQAGQKVPYPPSNDTTSVLYANSPVTIKLGQDSSETCEIKEYCNGELREDAKYYIRLLGENEFENNSQPVVVFLGFFETAKSQEVSVASIGAAGLITLIVLAILLLILFALLVVYCLRHGQRFRSKRGREPRQAPLQRPHVANPHPLFCDQSGHPRESPRGSDDNVDGTSPDDVDPNFQPLNNSLTSETTGLITVTAAPTTGFEPQRDLPRLQTQVQTPYLQNPPLTDPFE